MQSKWISNLMVLGVAVGVPSSASAQVCRPLPECRPMEAQTQAWLGQLQVQFRELEGSTGSVLCALLRDSRGRVCHMTQYDAERMCQELGTRLPTAHELAAVYSQRLGVGRFRDTTFHGVVSADSTVQAEIEQMDRDGYAPIYAANASGQQAVDFYS